MRSGWITGRIADFRVTTQQRLRLLRLLGYAGRRKVGLLCAVHAFAASNQPLLALTTGAVVANLTGDVRGSALVLVCVLIGLLAAGHAAELAQELLGISASNEIDRAIRNQVRGVAIGTSGLTELERSAFHDELTRAADPAGLRGRTRSPGLGAVGQLALMFRVVGALASAAVIATAFPAVAVLLLVCALSGRAIVRRQWMHLATVDDQGVGGRRRVRYWTELGSGAGAAKEVRIFGLGGWLLEQHQAAFLSWLGPMWRSRRAVLRRQTAPALLSLGAAFAAYLLPGIAGVTGRVEADTVATALIAAWGVLAMSFMGHEAFDIENGIKAIEAFDRLTVTAAPRQSRPISALPTAGPPVIRLERVGFCYPNGRESVLTGIELEIPPGEVLAVVGRNGAGKTTLVKLLAGLYAPTTGSITVAGKDLAQSDAREWRAQMCAVFQDFVRYPTSLYDNIALAAAEHSSDRAGVLAAAQTAGLAGDVDALPAGLETPVWREAHGGVDLSGGQWQKVALARALFAVRHGRQLVVLDEPTAHLSVAAEAEFFDRIVEAVRGTSIVLISHRLSTVRHADRIVMLANGRIEESGDHADLVRHNGSYARLFRLQAAGFEDGEATSDGSTPDGTVTTDRSRLGGNAR